MSGPDGLPVSLDEVINFVGRLHPDADPLLQLQDAVVVGGRLATLGDDLVGHYVHQARSVGATWSAIGESMGVTKQAAQQRFVASVGDHEEGLLGRFTPRGRQVLVRGRDEAKRRGASEVETVDLVVGLAGEPDGLAMVVVSEMGVTADQIRDAAAALAPAASSASSASKTARHTPFAPESRTVLQVAVEEALRLGHNYVGTEHLLLGILAAPETGGAKVLLGLGVTRRKSLTRLERVFERIVAERTGR
jgi:hypothetical protein